MSVSSKNGYNVESKLNGELYVRKEDCGQVNISETVNRTLLVPACDASATANSPALLATDDA
ncbi:MAG: hypothetical protein STHCBS139747_004754 [Sporothrix thermara]